MSKKLTPWFPPHVKPVHKGVYETTSPSETRVFQYWGGEFFGLTATSVDDAMRFPHEKSRWQDDAWRGLAKKP